MGKKENTSEKEIQCLVTGNVTISYVLSIIYYITHSTKLRRLYALNKGLLSKEFSQESFYNQFIEYVTLFSLNVSNPFFDNPLSESPIHFINVSQK